MEVSGLMFIINVTEQYSINKVNKQKKKILKVSTVIKNVMFSTSIILTLMKIDIGRFDPAEHFSINKEGRFYLTKVVFLRSEVVNDKLKNSEVSTIMKDALFFKSIIPILIKINI
jgi:hypothetical protein